jgi:D-alanyl-D-alanine carboxypeptidase/D-alanyl-D-alanine-endopeptidase (penicillin-binding protein 4)
MQRHPAREAFVASLPTGGGAGSTLRNRLADVRVRAKTGSIEYARALSGYVTGPSGATIAFSIMANNFTTDASRIRAATDGIVRALATGRRPDTDDGPDEPDDAPGADVDVDE